MQISFSYTDYIIGVIGLMLIWSCNPNTEHTSIFEIDEFKIGEKQIPIDAVTGHNLRSMELRNLASGPVLSYVNQRMARIYVHDWQSGRLLHYITLRKEGPWAVGESKIFGHSVMALDSVWCYNPDTYTLYLLGKDEHILNSYSLNHLLDNALGHEVAFPEVGVNTPIQYLSRNQILLNGALTNKSNDYTKVYTCLVVDLGSDSMYKRLPYPYIYNTGNFGDYLKYITYTLALPKKNILVSSFPMRDSLLVTSMDGTFIRWVSSTSNLFEVETIEPVGKMANVDLPNREEQWMYDFVTPGYSMLQYDSINQLFFRMTVNRPATDEIIKANGGDFRKHRGFSILVMNDHLERIAEVNLPYDTYSPLCMFAEGGKLFLQPLPSLQPDEGFLTFHVFDLSKLKPDEHAQ